jgi:hypothetical protein
MNASLFFFEITVRAGSPRSQGILNKRAASSPELLNISHRGTKPKKNSGGLNGICIILVMWHDKSCPATNDEDMTILIFRYLIITT